MGKNQEILQNVIFRSIKKQDALEMCKYINKLSQEDTFVRFSGEKVSLDEEIEYVNQSLKKIGSQDKVMIIAELNSKIVGIGEVERDFSSRKRNLHRGIFGLSIDKDYRGNGIGKKLMEIVIAESIKIITDLKMITLHVFEENYQAISLYKKLGFAEYGRLPKGVLYRGKYMSEISMFKEIK